MSLRVALTALSVTALAAVAACQSSGRYGTPAVAGAAVGTGMAGAAVSRVAGRCFAQCIAGTVCNPATGFCDPARELTPVPTAGPAAGRPPPHPPLAANASYEPGHVYEVPAVSTAEVVCDPATASHGDAGAVWCETDASAPQ